jgi:hypothetical protein
MGDKPGRKPKSPVPGRFVWPSIELFLALVLMSKVAAIVHQVAS